MSVIYLYGFVPPDADLPAGGLLGVGDAEVELLPQDDFSAVVSRLPAAGYSGEELERRGGDVEWMAEQGLRHEQVVAWFVDHAAILPSRLLTLFSSTAALADRVAADPNRIRGALRRFGHLREWDLKVGYDRAAVGRHLAQVSPEIGRLDEEIAGAAPGRAFLLRKKRTDLARTESRAAAVRMGHELLSELTSLSEEVARLDPPATEVPLVLNAALLIHRDRETEALAVARRHADRVEPLGLTVQFTGPWAPYRFLDEDHG